MKKIEKTHASKAKILALFLGLSLTQSAHSDALLLLGMVNLANSQPSGVEALPLVSVGAAIALPAYQDYIAKSQVARVAGELAAARDLVDVAFYEDKVPVLGVNSTDKEEGLALLDENSNPRSNLVQEFALTGFKSAEDGEGKLSATIGGKAVRNIQGLQVTYERTKDGEWQCYIEGKSYRFTPKYIPAGCKKR